MKLKTSELIDRFQSLSNISHDKTTGRIAMAVMCNIKALEELYKATLQTIEDTNIFLMKQYGEVNNERRNKAGDTDIT